MGKKSFLCLILCMFMACCWLKLWAEASQASRENRDELFSRAIIRLEHKEEVRVDGSPGTEMRVIPGGTAFFVSTGRDLFLVSARHVVEKGYDMLARVRARHKGTGETRDFLLKLPRDRWIFHPEQGDKDTHYVDVAAMLVNSPSEYKLPAFDYEHEPVAGKGDVLHEGEKPVPVLICGFRGDLNGLPAEERPIARLGIVPAESDKSLFRIDNGKFVESRAFLVSSQIFEGNSGSPVFRAIHTPEHDEDMRIVGLVIGTDETGDFAVVEPASRIGETLNFAGKRTLRSAGFWFTLAR